MKKRNDEKHISKEMSRKKRLERTVLGRAAGCPVDDGTGAQESRQILSKSPENWEGEGATELSEV